MNKRVKMLLAIFVIILVCFGCYLKYRKLNSNFEIKSDQWALYNYGQTIKSSNGIKGIDINILKAWKITKGNPNVLVAVVDSGVDTSDKGLSDAIYSKGKYNKDFYYNDNTIYDSYLQDYHGTYIANTIACYDLDSKIYGVAPEVSILPIKFLRNTSGSVSDAIRAINYACEIGAKIINCSWNFMEYNDELYNVIASHPNVLFVCAAGNSNLNLDKENIYPTSYDLSNILTVLAIDNTGKVYNSSGRGMKVDIAAPGVNIITILPENDITYINGTSIATAFVSGVTALMLSVNNRLTPEEVIDIVINNANKIDTLDGKCSSGGIIDAYSCLTAAKDIK